MRKIIVAVLFVNIVFALWALYLRAPLTPRGLNVFCEASLKLSNDRDGSVFDFDGTIVTRFKADGTGYLNLLGVAGRQGKIYNVSREVNFSWVPKDEDGIYGITLHTATVTQGDNTPNELVENNITGRMNVVNSYIVRHANHNTWSIGNIYTPIVMCVDKKN